MQATTVVTKTVVDLTVREYVTLRAALANYKVDLTSQEDISPEERKEDLAALASVNAKLKSAFFSGELRQS